MDGSLLDLRIKTNAVKSFKKTKKSITEPPL